MAIGAITGISYPHNDHNCSSSQDAQDVRWKVMATSMSVAFMHLLRNSWVHFTQMLGTNSLGLLVAIPTTLIGIGVTLFIVFRRKGLTAMKQEWKDTATTTGVVSLTIICIVYLPIFIWSVVTTAYDGHRKLQAKNLAIQKKLDLYDGPSIYYISSTNPAFGNIANATRAFGQISNPVSVLDEQKRPCQIRITAPKSNQELRETLTVIAVSAGCHVLQLGDSDMEPDLEAETNQGALPDFLLVHMAKDYPERGFLTMLGNVFAVKRTFALPPTFPKNVVWIQIGNGSPWRRH